MTRPGDDDKDKGMGTEEETRLRESDQTGRVAKERESERKALENEPPTKSA
jgi:hypothetical protein